jgi:predicted transcriptional regulator of viral defense system
MSIVWHLWYSIDMTHYDDIFETAIDNFGLITSAEAKDMGIANVELVKLAKRGRLDKIGHGVYRLRKYIPSQNDPYAIAVALVGPEAYLYGEAVIGMLQLAPTNPSYIPVASPKRTRKALPEYIRINKTKAGIRTTVYDGVPSQRAEDAIRSSKGRIMIERLIDATPEAHRQGYITQRECDSLLTELGEK